MDKKRDRFRLAEELDPHHLAALMSFTFANQQDGSHGLHPPSQPVKYGVTDDYNTSLRIFPVLDTIAGISISEVESRVVAVAMQLNSQIKEIHLTIAANQTDKEKLVSHLTAVWEKLKALSNTYAENSGDRDKKSNSGGGSSPEIPPDVALPLRTEIFRDVYQFCMEKQMKRIKKWLEALNSFMQQLIEHRGNKDLKGSELNLSCVVTGFSMILGLLMKLHDNPATQLADHEWEEMYKQSMWVAENATIALKDGIRCETLAREVKGYCSGTAFQLRRALEKLTFLARHIHSLISLAHSPRLRPALQYAISISTVPEQTRTVQLPRSREQWQSILEVACTERCGWQREKAEELLKKFGSAERVCPVHSECELIQYLEVKRGSPWDDIPPFPYIGVSRPSCSACRNWITAFNSLGGRQFYIGRTSGKWYWPWGMPMGKESLGGIMARKVSREYLAYRDLKSITATAAWIRTHNCPSAADRELVLARFAAAEQKYGGTPLGWLQGRLSELRDGRVSSKKRNGKAHSS